MSQFTRFWNGLGEAATAAFLASTASAGERWAPEGSEIMSSTHCAKEKSAAATAAEGAARALVERARADGVGIMYLHTHPFLPGAQYLWEKEGWRVVVREEEEPWWTIHMRRELK